MIGIGRRWLVVTLAAAALATVATQAVAYQTLYCNGHGYEEISQNNFDFACYWDGTWHGDVYQGMTANCAANGTWGGPYCAKLRLYVQDPTTGAWSQVGPTIWDDEDVRCVCLGCSVAFGHIWDNLIAGRHYDCTIEIYTGTCPPGGSAFPSYSYSGHDWTLFD